MRLRLLFLYVSICLYTQVDAQSNLNRHINIDSIDNERIGLILKKISAKAQFAFVYNNQAVPADSLITVNNFNGTLYSFLSNTLGPNYEFKEVPGYIVLRHAPYKMLIIAAIDHTNGQQLTITGQVISANDNRPIGEVSIYEKNQLVSTLTDAQGKFELELTNEQGAIKLTAVKENYRETSILFLQEVAVNSKKKKAYKYYPGGAVNKFSKSFAGLFIGSKQRVQSMNLGGFFAFSPYQVSLTPGLSTHGMYSGQVIDNVSINLLGGYTAGVQGIELGGLFNIDRGDARFLQVAGIFNVVGGNITGVQLSGIYNQVLDTAGGLQVAGIANSANEVKGLQFAGLFNVAKKVKGVQLAGFFNVADSSDYPIALVNFVKNGRKSLSLSYDELQYTHIDFRSGGRVLYGLVGAGYNFARSDKYAFDAGFGAHILNTSSFSLDVEYEYEALTDFKKDPDQIISFKLLAGLKLSKWLTLFAAPDIGIVSYSASDPIDFHGWQLHKFTSGNNVNNIYAGITGGLQFTW